MPEEFDPLRILAGLRAHGVSYVLAGELAAFLLGSPIETDDVEIYLPDDDANFERLVLVLDELGARQAPEVAGDEHRVSFETVAGRLDCVESPSVFENLNARATDLNLERGVVVRVASVDDLAELKRASGDLSGAVRLSALANATSASEVDLTGPVDADPPPKGPIDRILRKLGEVDEFIADLNSGEYRRGRRRS